MNFNVDVALVLDFQVDPDTEPDSELVVNEIVIALRQALAHGTLDGCVTVIPNEE